jgi:diamine N-acetyltransferase
MSNLIKIQVIDESYIPVIQDIANKTWRPTYGNLLTEEQSVFMLSMMYSEDSLRKQFSNSTFLILFFDEKPMGFSCFEIVDNQYAKLHKIYFLPETQGKGFGKLMIEQVSELAQEKGAKSLVLNVNRHNKAKNFYEKLGFIIDSEEDIDIGNGFWMNDFVMKKML